MTREGFDAAVDHLDAPGRRGHRRHRRARRGARASLARAAPGCPFVIVEGDLTRRAALSGVDQSPAPRLGHAAPHRPRPRRDRARRRPARLGRGAGARSTAGAPRCSRPASGRSSRSAATGRAESGYRAGRQLAAMPERDGRLRGQRPDGDRGPARPARGRAQGSRRRQRRRLRRRARGGVPHPAADDRAPGLPADRPQAPSRCSTAAIAG